MAQFRASISGQRGEASRLGSKNSGITAYVNGWTAGVRVIAEHVDGKDRFGVYRTNGSGYGEPQAMQLVASFTDENPTATTDIAAMNGIAALMSGNEWDADMLDVIADIVRQTGRAVENSDEYEDADA